MAAALDAGTKLDMFELGWFGQGPGFWRWIETPAAAPYIRACAAMRAPIAAEAPALAAIEGEELLDPVALEELAASIEREFGERDPA